MKVTIVGKNLEVSDYLRNLTDKKVAKLERFLKPDTQVSVTLAVERSRHICEVTIPFDGVVLRAEEVTGDMYASIDTALDKLERQIRRHRTKLARDLRAEIDFPQAEDEADEPERRIVRTKRFAYKPMSVEDAILEMNLLGHTFYMFNNIESGMIATVYRRRDGGCGLIELESL